MKAKNLAWVLLALALAPLCCVSAAEAEAESDFDAAQTKSKTMARPALLPGAESMAAELMPADGGMRGLDGYRWLDAAKQEGMLVHRAAHQAPAKGAALLVSAKAGAQGVGSLLGQLRQTLPAKDWDSYLVGLPLQGQKPSQAQQQVLVQRVSQALSLLQAAHPDSPLVVVGEGSVCDALAALFTPDGSLQAAGLVLLNQPAPKTRDGALAKLEMPTLVLQVLPNRYPAGYPLAEAVKMRQLPRVSPRQPKSLVVRQVQGWLRQFEEPVVPPGLAPS